MLPIFDRIVRGTPAKPAGPMTHVLALKWSVHTRAERNEILELEAYLRSCGIADLHLDSVETGARDLVFWLHSSNPKRAFKELAKMAPIAERMPSLQAAYAERDKLRFTSLWPK